MMTVHKLTAGDGYTYLTRQVASMDEPRVPGQSLADYYTARGNPPGIWIGAGAATLGVAGGAVSEAQMRALFGDGAHPDRDALLAAGAPEAATRLGTRYPTYQPLPPRAERVAAAARVFEAEHGRPPTTVEYQRLTAVEARRERRPVAGYDLVFTPVKSVSLLWALGGPDDPGRRGGGASRGGRRHAPLGRGACRVHPHRARRHRPGGHHRARRCGVRPPGVPLR